MHFFEYKNGQLHCEGIPIYQIEEKVGTPFYLYSYNTLVRHFTVFNNAFEGIPHLVCYSAKANSNLGSHSPLHQSGRWRWMWCQVENSTELSREGPIRKDRILWGWEERGRDRICFKGRNSYVQCGVFPGTSGHQ